jgi:hypothetical protein
MFNLLDLSEWEREKENIIKKEISTFYVELQRAEQNNWLQLISEQGEKRKKNLNAGWACVQCQRMIHASSTLLSLLAFSSDIWHATLVCVIFLIPFYYLIEFIIAGSSLYFRRAICFSQRDIYKRVRLSAEEKAPAGLDKFVSIMARLNKFH